VRRLGRSGLRWKLVLALVATSAATLAAAAAALIPPLEHRIAADRLDAMRRLAGTASLDLRRLPARDLRANSPRLDRIVVDLQRRTGAQVELFDANGAALRDTDPGGPTRPPARTSTACRPPDREPRASCARRSAAARRSSCGESRRTPGR
jgi:hypothetical protein